MTPKVENGGEAFIAGLRFMELVGIEQGYIGSFTVHCDGHGPRVVQLPPPKKVEIDRPSAMK